MLKKVFYVVMIVSLNIIEVSAQGTSMMLDLGVIERTTVFYNQGTKGLPYGPSINADAPYSYKKGVNGIGINAAIGYRICRRLGINIQAGATVRYDFYYWQSSSGKSINTIYVDVNGLISKTVYKSFYGGVGFTTYNIGKNLTYYANYETKTLQLAFNSIDLLIGFKIMKIFIEPKFSIVQQDFPGTIKDNATLLGIRIYYRFFGN